VQTAPSADAADERHWSLASPQPRQPWTHLERQPCRSASRLVTPWGARANILSLPAAFEFCRDLMEGAYARNEGDRSSKSGSRRY